MPTSSSSLSLEEIHKWLHQQPGIKTGNLYLSPKQTKASYSSYEITTKTENVTVKLVDILVEKEESSLPHYEHDGFVCKVSLIDDHFSIHSMDELFKKELKQMSVFVEEIISPDKYFQLLIQLSFLGLVFKRLSDGSKSIFDTNSYYYKERKQLLQSLIKVDKNLLSSAEALFNGMPLKVLQDLTEDNIPVSEIISLSRLYDSKNYTGSDAPIFSQLFRSTTFKTNIHLTL